jgi:hypothetical protein
MPGIGFLHRIHGEGADGVDDIGLRRLLALRGARLRGAGGVHDLGHGMGFIRKEAGVENTAEGLENAFISSNMGLYLRTFSPRYFSLG